MRRLRPGERPRFARRAMAERSARVVRARTLEDQPVVVHEVMRRVDGSMQCSGCPWAGNAVQAVAHAVAHAMSGP